MSNLTMSPNLVRSIRLIGPDLSPSNPTRVSIERRLLTSKCLSTSIQVWCGIININRSWDHHALHLMVKHKDTLWSRFIFTYLNDKPESPSCATSDDQGSPQGQVLAAVGATTRCHVLGIPPMDMRRPNLHKTSFVEGHLHGTTYA